jgi:hypothetical protein
MILRAVFESLFDRLHVKDFSRHAKVLYQAINAAIAAGDESIIAQMVEQLVAVTEAPREAIERFVSICCMLGFDVLALKQMLWQFLIDLRCASPNMVGELCKALCDDYLVGNPLLKDSLCDLFGEGENEAAAGERMEEVESELLGGLLKEL